MGTAISKEEAMESFAFATEHVLSTFLGQVPKMVMGAPTEEDGVGEVMVIVGIGGELVGRMILEFSLESALALCQALHEGEAFTKLDGMARDTLAELGNLAAGRAVNKLHEQEVKIAIAPPIVLEGSQMETSQSEIASIALLSCDYGALRVNTALSESLQLAKSKERPPVCQT